MGVHTISTRLAMGPRGKGSLRSCSCRYISKVENSQDIGMGNTEVVGNGEGPQEYYFMSLDFINLVNYQIVEESLQQHYINLTLYLSVF